MTSARFHKCYKGNFQFNIFNLFRANKSSYSKSLPKIVFDTQTMIDNPRLAAIHLHWQTLFNRN